MRVLVLSSFTKSLFWFRMEFMQALLEAGHEVYALGSDDDDTYRREFQKRGIHYDSFSVSRNGLSPWEDWRTYRELRAAIEAIAPDKVFVYQAKTIVYGCPAAKRAGVGEVYPLVAGLGSIFRSGGIRNHLIQQVLKIQYRRAFALSSRVFFQNADDRDLLVSLGLVPREKAAMLHGSGVNLDHFADTPIPSGPSFLFVGRLIADKGVIEYLEACRVIKQRYPSVRCLLVGPYDSNPSSLTPADLEPYISDQVIEYVGEQSDVRPYIRACSVFVLPSYHEGTPKSVLEAMSMGRAIITTDAPGCRETVDDGKNGFLVPTKDTEALASRMEQFVLSELLSARMGRESRRIAEERFDVHKVNKVIMTTMGLAPQTHDHERDVLASERGV